MSQFWCIQVTADSTNRSTGVLNREIPTAKNVINDISGGEEIVLNPKTTNLQLFQMMAGDYHSPAGHCLRCYISHQIKISCIKLTERLSYGRTKFTEKDIFPYALNDRIYIGKEASPLAIKIISRWNPHIAQLSTYIHKNQLVRQDPFVVEFLESHGVSVHTDWGILNDVDTTTGKVERVLNDQCLSSAEVENAKALITCFREVYSRDRRGKKGKCESPTSEQLQEMCKLLGRSFPEKLLSELLVLAGYIRNGRKTKGEPKNIIRGEAAEITIENMESPSYDWESSERYQQIEEDAITAIQTTINSYNLDEKKREYLRAFQLYLCQGFSQLSTAKAMGWSNKDNSKVSRKLDFFRSNVRKRLFITLREGAFAEEFTEAAKNDKELKKINNAIDLCLTKNIVPGNKTVLSCAVCKHLELIGII